jgi:hypothetical protein
MGSLETQTTHQKLTQFSYDFAVIASVMIRLRRLEIPLKYPGHEPKR